MKNIQLSFLTIIGAIAVTATSSLAESTATPSKVTFSCQVNNNVPTTVLEAEGTQKVIFNWKSELFDSNHNPHDLCDDVTSKLNNYSADENHNLSALTFKADVLGENIPMICATDEPSACEQMLFTLNSDREAIKIANQVLDDILDKDLQAVKTVDNRRGLQSVSHSIDIWELILGRKLMKNF